MDPYTAATFHNASILAHSVLHGIEKNYEKNNELSDVDLIQLYHIYGDISEKALTILENSSIVRFVTEDKTVKIYQVEGSSGIQYLIYPNYNYCACSAYKYHVCKIESLYLTCKHILAAKLAEITQQFKDETISHTGAVELLMSSFITNT
uniref:SWIM-type domain-containing protein n=1 Tax=Cuerna arida TaxID=1464854 RepID=A0A1B6EWP2_9HEMI